MAKTSTRTRLAERRGLILHLIIYVLANAGLALVWATTGPDDFFWPALPLLFWGAGLLTPARNAALGTPGHQGRRDP